MPYTTYTELKAAVLDQSHYSSAVLTTPIIDFVTIAEEWLSRDLRLPALITFGGTVTVAALANTGTLPTGCRGIVSAKVPTAKLNYVTPDKFDDAAFNANSLIIPTTYSWMGSSLYVSPTWTAGGNVTINYFKKETVMSGSTASNQYLTLAPDMLLAACMIQVGFYLQDDQAVQRWRMLYEYERDRLNDQYGVLDAHQRAMMISTGKGKSLQPST